jgi:hypothetical protein
VTIGGRFYSIFTREMRLYNINTGYFENEKFAGKDLKKLKRFVNLDILSIMGSGVSDLEFLRGKKTIKDLTLKFYPENTVTDFSPLLDCVNVEYFSAQGFHSPNLDMLANMKNLTWLDMWSIKNPENPEEPVDISALSNLTQLSSLTLERTNCGDCSVLLEMENLSSIYIDDGELTEEQVKILEDKGVNVSLRDKDE